MTNSDSYKPGHPKQFPFRYCPYCNNKIPKYTHTGNLIRKSKYQIKKTCRRSACLRLAVLDYKQQHQKPQLKIVNPEPVPRRIVRPDMGVHGLFL